MTDSNLTEIIAVIDRSGSMADLVQETIGGYNNFLEEQKQGPGKAIVTLVQFDDQYQLDYNGVDVNDAAPLTTITEVEKRAKEGATKLVAYQPRGMTALLDAVGKTIVAVGERLAQTPEEKRPGQVIFLIITDGLENASQEYNVYGIREMVQHQTDKYSWTFVFMGGGDAAFQGAQMAIDHANVAAYSANSAGYGCMFGSVSTGVSRRRKAAAAGQHVNATASLLTDEEKQAQIVEDDDGSSSG